MTPLVRYLELIVEPTFEEFKRNPTSLRHAYLACVATYHAIDRVSYPRKPAALRQKWGRKSLEFLLVDHIAHDFKHIKSRLQNPPKRGLPLSCAIYGQTGFNTHMLNDTGQVATLRHLTFVVRDAITFVRKQAMP